MSHQDFKRCEILLAGDLCWDDVDDGVTTWFQYAAAYNNNTYMDDHVRAGRAIRDKLKDLRKQRKLELR